MPWEVMPISLAGLTCDKTYHYSVYAENPGATETDNTDDATFTTLPCGLKLDSLTMTKQIAKANNKYTDGWYSFALDDVWCWRDCERQTQMVSQGEGTLNATGHLSVSVPVNIDDKPLSQILTIEADVTDPNNQVVSNRFSRNGSLI